MMANTQKSVRIEKYTKICLLELNLDGAINHDSMTWLHYRNGCWQAAGSMEVKGGKNMTC